MPNITIYVNDETYMKLKKEKYGPSNIIQKLLEEHYK